MILWSPFLGKRRIVHFSNVLHNRRSTSSNFLVFNTSGGISSRPAAFLLLVCLLFFFSTASGSFFIIFASLMSNCPLIILAIDLSVIPEGFPSRFLKCFLQSWSFFFSAGSWVLLLWFFSFHLHGAFDKFTDFFVGHLELS